MALFFPDFEAPTVIVRRKKPVHTSISEHEPELSEGSKAQAIQQVKRTIAVVGKSAYLENQELILEKIQSSGFNVAVQKEFSLTRQQALDIFNSLENSASFDKFITQLSDSPLLVIGLAKEGN
ncbi:unnamed protein product [Protopolystoma xenopodis]|uniref:Uncharacterized protein n=1 Tax=Protopolystoma xenopodis TaxID=117903 RepID=A0A448X586_9PLAT|nr:unnamed protein product [Protopolystoma xenopodis]